MSEKPHILIITPGFARNEQDDCIPAFQDFIDEWSSFPRQFHLTIVATQYPEKGRYMYNGIDVFAIGGKNKRGLSKIRTWSKALSIVRKVHKAKPIDLIHSLWLREAALLGDKFSGFYRIPHMCTLMGQDARADNTYWRQVSPDMLVTLSEYQKGFLEGRENVQIPWSPRRVVQNSEEKGYDIVGVGSLIQVKNWRRFIDIASCVNGKPRVAIIGGGVLESELKAYADDKNVSIEFTGEIERNRVLGIMRNSKVLLHTADYESYCMAMVEASMQGCHVFSTSVGIAPELDEIRTFQNEDEAVSLISAAFNSSVSSERASETDHVLEAYFNLYTELIEHKN